MAILIYLHGRYAAIDFHNHVNNFFSRLLFNLPEGCLRFMAKKKKKIVINLNLLIIYHSWWLAGHRDSAKHRGITCLSE